MNGEWVPLRVLVVNTHVGILLSTAVRDLLTHERYHAVLLQEVQSPVARAKLRLVFPRRTWRLVGVRPPSTGRGSSGTIIATRRSRLGLIRSSNRKVSAYLNRFHPERRLTRGTYRDMRTNREVTLLSMHAWHIMGATPEILREHDRQLNLYGLATREAHTLLQTVVAGGDVNEHRQRGVASKAMREAHMRPVMYDGIDALFVSQAVDVRVESVRAVEMADYQGGEQFHNAISATFMLRVLESQPVDSDL